MDMGEEPKVKVAANIFRELCYNNRDNLSAGIIVGGWDKTEGGQVSKDLLVQIIASLGDVSSLKTHGQSQTCLLTVRELTH